MARHRRRAAAQVWIHSQAGGGRPSPSHRGGFWGCASTGEVTVLWSLGRLKESPLDSLQWAPEGLHLVLGEPLCA